MATVDKNFRIKNGLAVEGSVATVNGNQILTENASDTYILNLIGGETLVKSVTSDFYVSQGGELAINESSGIARTSDIPSSSSIAADLAGGYLYVDGSTLNVDSEGLYDAFINNGVATTTNISDAIAAAASNYDAAGSASAAQTAAQSYADGLAVNYDAAGAAATAESNAEFYTDNAIGNLGGSGTASVDGNIDVLTGTGIQVNGGNNSVEIDRQTVDTWYDAAGSASSAQQAAELYADNAVAALVGSAPAVLDTIQELATALENNPDIIADLENVAAGKQNTLTAGSNIDITQDTISVTGLDTDDVAEGPSRLYFTNTRAQDAIGAGTGLTKDGQGTELAINRQVVDTWYDAAGAAASAQTAAEGFATTAASNAQSAAEATAQAALDDVLDSTTPFTSINVNDVMLQMAAASTGVSADGSPLFGYDGNVYKNSKLIVKLSNGTHTQVSEFLVAQDAADNLAVTEYAIVTTNGALGDVYLERKASNGTIGVKVNPLNGYTLTSSVLATLLK